jgi:ABC-type transport system substrate-binding protein
MKATSSRISVMSLAATLSIGLASCAPPSTPVVTARWLAMRPVPLVDPAAPPDEMRWAVERLLGRGLVDEDSSGRIVPALARAIAIDEDRRTYVFTFRAGLRYAGGDSLRSADLREALERGLSRRDHATHRWLLRAVEGVEAIRPGRPLPKLGIETPDDTTLILRLARPDSLLLTALALPGVSTPWRFAEGVEGWSALDGVGPYRLIAEHPGRSLELVRRASGPLPFQGTLDTLWIRFATGARARSLLRSGTIDVGWPLPIGDPILGDSFEGLRRVHRAPEEMRPGRRLELVLRADVAPTAKLAARRALAHSLNRPDLERALADEVGPFRAFWAAVRPFDFPRLDEQEALAWMSRGKLGRSFHTTLVYDPDEIGEPAARRLQSHWARSDLSVDLRPLRGSRLATERLTGRAQLLLQVHHDLLADPATDLAMIAPPGRDAPVGRYRTGWRTSDFRILLAPGARRAAAALEAAQRDIEEATVILPLGRVGGSWLERVPAPGMSFHPRYGVQFTTSVTSETDRR